MIGSARIVGIILVVIGLILLVVGGAWIFSETITVGGRVLAMLLGLLVLMPIIGIGVYLIRLGGAEKQDFARVEQEKKLLNSVLTQGQVSVGELVVTLGVPRDDVEDMIRSVVGKRLFSGAIDWNKGMLYSVDSQKLVGEQKCPNCGGDVKFAGKGLIVCPYCGSQVFLTERAAAAAEAMNAGAAPAASGVESTNSAAPPDEQPGANSAAPSGSPPDAPPAMPPATPPDTLSDTQSGTLPDNMAGTSSGGAA